MDVVLHGFWIIKFWIFTFFDYVILLCWIFNFLPY